MRAMKRAVGITVLISATFALFACGESGVSEAELERQRAEAAQNARQEAKIEALEEKVREQEQNPGSVRLKAEDGEISSPQPGQIPSDARYCGSAYGAGTASCPFVENVSGDFYASGQSGTFSSYSPTTGLVYTVTCNGDEPTVCTAGRGAVIYIP
jgi:hypothetical protein